MGHHFIPQHYLRGFAAVGQKHLVWTYDKRARTRKLASIDKVAQSSGFYDPEIEIQLARDIEIPGNAVLRKLTEHHPISDQERMIFSLYIGTNDQTSATAAH